MTLEGIGPGARIVVRHETGRVGPSGGPEMTDVIGHVRQIDPESITVETRTGELRTVDRASIVNLKQVPDAPARRRRVASASVEELTSVGSLGWPAAETESLGQWMLRASGGFTSRANSAVAVGDPGCPLEQALDQVKQFYAARGLPPRIQTEADGHWHADALAAGWTPLAGPNGGADVYVLDLRARYDGDPEVRLSRTADDEWLSNYGRVDHPDAARAVLEGPERAVFLTLGQPGVAWGRVAITGEWAGLSALTVKPEHRRHGLARRMVHTMLATAQQAGADKAYLHVAPHNSAAIELYRGFGFGLHHRYVYLEPTP